MRVQSQLPIWKSVTMVALLLLLAFLVLVARLTAQTPQEAPAQPQSPASSPSNQTPDSTQAAPPSQPGQNQPSLGTQIPQTVNAPASSANATAPFGEITGVVKSGNMPLPGVTVTAANTLTGKKYITSTEPDGSFKIVIGGKGRYVVRAEFSAFAPVTQEVILNEQNRIGKADLSMILLSRAEQQAQQQQQQQRQQIAQQMGGAGQGRPGMQQLSLTAGGESEGAGATPNDAASLASAGLPNAGLAAEGNTESVAVSGNMGRAEQNPFDPGEMQDRIADLREELTRQGGGSGTINLNGGTANIQILGGGPGGFGGGGFGGGMGGGPMVIMMGGGPGGGGRGMRGFNVNKPHGSIFYSYGGSILDAKPYSLSGQPEEKADYNRSTFGFTMGGPLNIPHIYHGGTRTFLFGNYTGSRGTSAYDVFSNVPTLAERNGDFSSLLNQPRPTQLFNPVTLAPIPNNMISTINPASAQLLPYIPLPNLPGTSNNFHFVSAQPSSTDTMMIRFNHSFSDQGGAFGRFGARAQQRQQQRQAQNGQKGQNKWTQSINGGFVFNDLRNTVLNPFPGLGGHQTIHNMNANVGYSAVKGLFLNSLRFTYNHSNTNGVNQFTNVNNIEGQLGITGVSQLPADYGLPVLNFQPQLSSLRDITPVVRNNQTFTISDSMSLTRGKHSWTWGGDFRRIFTDVRNASNARGTFTFTGDATLDPANPLGARAPFADFLLGYAQQTSTQFGSEDYQFRANSWDLFVQDNWRMGKNLTWMLGLRYEYVTPYVELSNQLANLDVAPGFSAVAVVLPGQTGPLTGQKYPSGLIKPDANNFAPRVGVAWKPFSKTVVRAGYGINYNLAQYGLMSTQLGFQPPFADAQINPATGPTSLTLQNGFPFTPASPDHITNTYAVDPNYTMAYVQAWNLNIQQEVKTSWVINIGYAGSKGTHLDMLRAPDQLPTGGPRFLPCTLLTPLNTPCVSPFLYESSEGSSILHAGTVRVRKRMRRGLSVGGTYTYSKSIDNASSIGGGTGVVAQNDLDIAAERGLSSFDQRHRFTTDYSYTLPFGKDQKWLKGGWAGNVFGGFFVSGNMIVASGTPLSPRIFAGASDLSRGVSGSLRPDLVPGQSIGLSDPSVAQWFNIHAFTTPAGVFGDASRNIITGPGTLSFDMSLSKNVQLKEMQAMEFRISASNVFNMVHYASVDTTLGSPTFGQVVAAGPMRRITLTTRYRF